MNNPYVVKLEQLLQEIPQGERQEILQDYLEHFRLAQAEGKTPEEIADALGAVEALAADILAEYRAGGASAAGTASGRATAADESGSAGGGGAGGAGGAGRPVPWWRTTGILVLTAILFIGLIWAFVGIKTDVADITSLLESSPADAASLASPSGGSSPEPAAALPASPEAKKPGGTVIIGEERKANEAIRSLQIETVDTGVVIETVKDGKLQVLLEGKITVREGEDWTDYYDFGADSSSGTFQVHVRPTEAKKQQMPAGRNTTLRIRLPDAPLENLDISTVSGSVKGPLLQADHFNGASVSGSIDLAGLKGKNHHFSNVSGKISLTSLDGDFSVDSVSGSVQISGASWESSSSVNTISGSVSLTADAAPPFAYELSSVSGSVKCGYENASESGILMMKQCSGSTGESKRTLTLTSISGPLQVGP